MPRWVFCTLAIASLGLVGCSNWPSQAHRDVTIDTIKAEMASACATAATDPELFRQLSSQLSIQEQQLAVMRGQLEVIATEALTETPIIAASTPVQACEKVSLVKDVGGDHKIVVGANEWIYLNPPGHHFQARIDTGAATSSLNALNVQQFERNGQRWVSFDLVASDAKTPLHLEAPMVRKVKIRQASYEEIERRPVVELDVALGNSIMQSTEFTLTDRTQMKYPVLLGRSFLRDLTLVDVAIEFTHPKYEPEQVIDTP